jgi:hypothetical protein
MSRHLTGWLVAPNPAAPQAGANLAPIQCRVEIRNKLQKLAGWMLSDTNIGDLSALCFSLSLSLQK